MLAAFGLAFVTLFAPDGIALRPTLEASSSRLPVDRLAEVLPRLWLVLHDNDEAPIAGYAPPVRRPARNAAEGRGAPRPVPRSPVHLLYASASRRPPSGVPTPALALYVPYFRDAGEWRAVEAMPLDVTDYLFRALAEAALDAHSRAADEGEAAIAFDRQSARAMTGVPATHRSDAFASAAASFLGNALSVANEVWRSEQRRKAMGRSSLCGLFDRPRTLFESWRERLFGDRNFPGLWSPEGEPARWSTSSLDHEAKVWLVGEVLGGDWVGDPAKDFAWLCEGASAG